MIDPIIGSALIGAAGQGGSALASIYGSKVSAKSAKKQAAMAAEQARLDREEQKREFDLSHLLEANKFNESAEQFHTQFDEQKRLENARKAAYEQMLGKAGTAQTGAETQLMGETAQASPELLQAEKDMAARTAEGIQTGQSQMQANLAQQGVRGGQAATQLRRGVGEMATTGMRDINQLKVDDAARRQAIRSAYLASKGSQAGAATYSAPSY